MGPSDEHHPPSWALVVLCGCDLISFQALHEWAVREVAGDQFTVEQPWKTQGPGGWAGVGRKADCRASCLQVCPLLLGRGGA